MPCQFLLKASRRILSYIMFIFRSQEKHLYDLFILDEYLKELKHERKDVSVWKMRHIKGIGGIALKRCTHLHK